MPITKQPVRRLPFPYASQSAEVDDEIQNRVEKRTSDLRVNFISSRNTYRLKHGRQWQTMHADDPDSVNEVRLHSTEIEISAKRVIDHDLLQLQQFLAKFPAKLHSIFVSNMLEVANQSTSKSGNVVSSKGFKEGFEEMLSKIAFSVDRFGKPSTPTALVPPAVMEQVRKLAAYPDPEYSARISAITEEKYRQAIENEARRISRYRFGEI